MAVSVTNQTLIFLYSLAAGAAGGILFDIFRTARRLRRAGTVWVSVQDLLFWFLTAIAAFTFLYYVNFGEPRWYIFFGIFLGALFYYLLFRNHMVSFLLWLAHTLFALLSFLLRLLLFPVRLLCRILSPVFFFVWAPCHAAGRRISRRCRSFSGSAQRGMKKIKKRLKMY